MKKMRWKDAKALGLKTYFTGKPCKNGHIAPRRVHQRTCEICLVERQREYMRERRKDPKVKERELERGREYNKERWKNPEYRDRELKRMRDRNKTPEYKEYRSNYVASERFKKYRRDRYKNDPEYKLNSVLRGFITRSINYAANKKDKATSMYTPFSIPELRERIESLMLDGMTWDNYGEWEIDHKVSIKSMVSQGIKDPAIVNALDNLIPMWSSHNKSKNSDSLETWLEKNPSMVYLYGHML